MWISASATLQHVAVLQPQRAESPGRLSIHVRLTIHAEEFAFLSITRKPSKCGSSELHPSKKIEQWHSTQN